MGFGGSLRKIVLLYDELQKVNKNFEGMRADIQDLKKAVEGTEYYSKRLDTVTKFSEAEVEYYKREIERSQKSAEEKDKVRIAELEKAKAIAVGTYEQAQALKKENEGLKKKVNELERKSRPFGSLAGLRALGETAGTNPPLSDLSKALADEGLSGLKDKNNKSSG